MKNGSSTELWQFNWIICYFQSVLVFNSQSLYDAWKNIRDDCLHSFLTALLLQKWTTKIECLHGFFHNQIWHQIYSYYGNTNVICTYVVYKKFKNSEHLTSHECTSIANVTTWDFTINKHDAISFSLIFYFLNHNNFLPIWWMIFMVRI